HRCLSWCLTVWFHVGALRIDRPLENYGNRSQRSDLSHDFEVSSSCSSFDLPSTANSLKMAGRLFASYWAKVGPYYTKAYQEVWVGLGIMGYLYYKLSYGGKKAVKDSKPAH
ncbi:hypothetical protein NQD34_017695, partial [Periophthalmus magnuspinnatus]